MTAHVQAPSSGALARKFPPIAQLVIASLALVVVAGAYMASKFPRRPPLGLPIALLVVSVALVVIAAAMTARLPDFAWARFRLVFGWALLAYVVQAGMIGYAFVHNHMSGSPLVVIILLLVMFALDVPFVIAFTAARYASPSSPTA